MIADPRSFRGRKSANVMGRLAPWDPMGALA